MYVRVLEKVCFIKLGIMCESSVVKTLQNNVLKVRQPPECFSTCPFGLIPDIGILL